MDYEYESDDTNSVLKWDNYQTNYFVLADAIKIASFLRF